MGYEVMHQRLGRSRQAMPVGLHALLDIDSFKAYSKEIHKICQDMYSHFFGTPAVKRAGKQIHDYALARRMDSFALMQFVVYVMQYGAPTIDSDSKEVVYFSYDRMN